MRYWLLTTEYPPFFGGGISTYCYNTAVMLSTKGHFVSIFINDATVNDIQVEEWNGIRVIRFNPLRTGSSHFLGHVTNISYEFAHVVKHFILKEGKPDVIEAQEYLGIAYYLLQYKYLLYEWCKEIPVLITMHSPSFLYMEYNHIPQYRYPNFWICEMERFCLQAANHIISPSEYMVKELYKRFELANRNLTIVPNPFANPREFPDKPEWNERANQIVFYGKLTAQKGAFRLLAYFKDLWEKGFNRPLYLLGGQDIVYHAEGASMGDLIRKRFKKYIQAGLLKMEDRIPPAQISKRLADAEVVIIPSNNDNLPYVVFEMMALGKILLVSRQGGQTEVIEHSVDGFIFDHESPETFGEQLQSILLLTNEQRKAISANAIKKVKTRYGFEVIYEEKIKVLNELTQRQHKTSIFPFVRPQKHKKQTERAGIPGKLSIVIPYYNMGKYIDETIQSVIQSDFENKEIIIVNDGSTDEASVRQLNNYRSLPQIKVIDISNGGLGNARNLGARVSSGEYLAFLDADDTVDSKYYSQAVHVFHEYENVDFAGCWIKYFGSSTKTWPAFLPEPPLILFHNLINTSSLVYKRSSFMNAGLNETNMVFQGLEDYESLINLLSNGYKGVAIPEALFNYRIRPDSMIRYISKEKKLFLYQYISHKHSRFYATFAADIFNLVNANGPGISLDNPSLDHNLADKLPFGGQASLRIISIIKRNRYAKRMAYKLYRLFKK
ncbi:glycosyltransferase [Terrimonas pollutisoli]|uniref:glycosyltransferase n=1 Tax=Terrimonas pollutisoli TaxID=3034147 RepID=UPI0023EC795F|nr:glycosyltransferase [Terrimonas sp. H1YJ31]